jgi:hypothetical protein
MEDCEPQSPIKDFHDRQLNNLRKMSGLNRLAIAAAMDYCSEYELTPPSWLVAASVDLMVDLLKREKSEKRGRTANSIARYRQDIWDYERYDAVLRVREMRAKARHNVRIGKDYPDHHATKHFQKMKVALGTSKDEFEKASLYLTGRDARAAGDAIRASYRRVVRRHADPKIKDRAVMFSDRFLKKIELQSLTETKPGTKRSSFSGLLSG